MVAAGAELATAELTGIGVELTGTELTGKELLVTGAELEAGATEELTGGVGGSVGSGSETQAARLVADTISPASLAIRGKKMGRIVQCLFYL